MSEISKAVGQWIVGNVGWTVLIILFILSSLFKITKRNVDPLGWVIGWIGKALTKDVRKDVADLKTETNNKFEEVKKDWANKIDELKDDYNEKIADLHADIDIFEANTNKIINDMKSGTSENCEILKTRLDAMEKSNDMQTVRQIKAHVLDFANSCMNGRKHTIEEFKNIIRENNEYNKYVEKYGLQNDVYKNDYEFIMEVYHDCKTKRTFLNDNGNPIEEDE